MTDQPEVKPGQVWADNDPRAEGRTLRVEHIVGGAEGSAYPDAICTILTNSEGTQHLIDTGGEHGYLPKDRRGKQTRISVGRFKPTRTGYRLVSDN